MNRRFVKDFLLLYNAGWRPYTGGKPDKSVYEKLGCPHAGTKGKEPFWFVRSETFLCVTCDKSCSFTRPEGFILPLPLEYSAAKPEKEFSLTPGEMVALKRPLRVDEAAYCLGVSGRQIYRWIDDGRLRRVIGGEPIRVSVDDVIHYMQTFEE